MLLEVLQVSQPFVLFSTQQKMQGKKNPNWAQRYRGAPWLWVTREGFWQGSHCWACCSQHGNFCLTCHSATLVTHCQQMSKSWVNTNKWHFSAICFVWGSNWSWRLKCLMLIMSWLMQNFTASSNLQLTQTIIYKSCAFRVNRGNVRKKQPLWDESIIISGFVQDFLTKHCI